jgi:hypothetical protein
MSDSTNITDQAGGTPPPAVPPPAPTHAHEHSDVNVGGIAWIGVALAVSAVVISPIVWGVYEGFRARDVREDVPQFPLAVQENARPLPKRIEGVPAPRLEGLFQREELSDRQDVRPSMLRPSQQPALNSYEWVEREKGRVVRIPIDVAMREVLRGKEFQTPRPAKKDVGDRESGLQAPAPPNSGRGAPGDER